MDARGNQVRVGGLGVSEMTLTEWVLLAIALVWFLALIIGGVRYLNQIDRIERRLNALAQRLEGEGDEE